MFSVPLMLSNLLQVLFNMVDVAVVGRFAGVNSFSAVMVAGNSAAANADGYGLHHRSVQGHGKERGSYHDCIYRLLHLPGSLDGTAVIPLYTGKKA